MKDHGQLAAYLATLAALVVIFLAVLIVSAFAPAVLGKVEMLGVGTVTGGLIGVLRLPTQRSVTVDNAASDPVPVEEKP